MRVFQSLTEALRQGYQVYDKTETHYIVRIQTSHGWALALAKR
jgi:hypothetical protein